MIHAVAAEKRANENDKQKYIFQASLGEKRFCLWMYHKINLYNNRNVKDVNFKIASKQKTKRQKTKNEMK